MGMIQRTIAMSFLVVAIAFGFDDDGKETDFKGLVQSLPTGLIGDWMVSGTTVHVSASTQVRQDDGPAVTGACVEVKGQPLADTSVNASEVRTQKAEDCGQAKQNNNVDFTAAVQSMPSGTSGDWTIGGRTVHVTAATQVKQEHGTIAVGSCVEVKGQLNADGTIAASEIDSEQGSSCGLVVGNNNDIEFQGTVKSLPASGGTGDWVVDTKTVHVSAATEIEQEHGPAAVGSCVDVQGQGLADGSINADKIEVESSSAGCGVHPPPPQQQELVGLVQTAPASGTTGDFQVSGRTVHVAGTTMIDQEHGVLTVGACVDVHGATLSDNSINASEVDTRQASDCAAAIGGVDVDLEGTIGSLPASGVVGDWQVNGQTVHVLPGTEIENDPASTFAAGQCVEVHGEMLADHSIDALSIEAKANSACAANPPPAEAEIMGLVEKLPSGGTLVSDWQVSGKIVHVLPGTQVKQENGAVMVGDCVEAKGTLAADQSLNATQVEVESISGTCISEPGVVDAASMSSGMVSPGEIVSMFGMRIGPSGLVTLQVGSDGKVTTSLSGVRVLFDGQPAPLLAVTGGQVNVVVPFAVAGKKATQIQVEHDGVWSNAVSVPVGDAHPGLFTINASGHDQAAALNQDGSVNSSSRQASRGEVVQLFATGFGMANRKLDDGEVVEDAKTMLAEPVEVEIGDMEGEVIFAGMDPQMVAGVVQINVRIPANAPTGSAVAVRVKAGNTASAANVTLAIR